MAAMSGNLAVDAIILYAWGFCAVVGGLLGWYVREKGKEVKTLYARIADVAHDTIADIAELAGLSMAATIETMVEVQAGRPHIYAAQYSAALAEYIKEEQ